MLQRLMELQEDAEQVEMEFRSLRHMGAKIEVMPESFEGFRKSTRGGTSCTVPTPGEMVDAREGAPMTAAEPYINIIGRIGEMETHTIRHIAGGLRDRGLRGRDHSMGAVVAVGAHLDR